ncbi:MAG: DsbA family protein [Candidatus Acidiferrales bacterium]
MIGRKFTLAAAVIIVGALPCLAQSAKPSVAAATGSVSPEQAQLLKTTEAFVRNLFAWGPAYQLKLGPLTQSPSPDFYVVPLQVTFKGQSDTGEVYVSKDGKTLFRGDMFDTNADPYADTRAKLHIQGNPAKGPADARVTLVEFADFECPHCQELEIVLKAMEDKYPVRLVYKDYPITQLHPWANTAAIGARCAFMQKPEAFWKIHDDLFANQDSITPENVWDKLAGFASQAGLDAASFKVCMSSPEAAKAVEANHADGEALGVNSTPTVFVNGRPAVGGDPEALQQLIEFELSAHPK